MMLLLYNLLLFVAAVVASPWWLLRVLTARKYREGFLSRTGLRLPVHLDALAGKRTLWVHAVSVGEVQAVLRLVRELERALPQARVLLSTTTRTGQQLARERLGAGRVFYFPLDFLFPVRRLLSYLHPALLVLAETEFWPNMLAAAKKRGIPVVVVNARISDRSWPRYRRLRGFWQPQLASLSRVLAQSDLDRERLAALGCTQAEVSGNLKFDVTASAEVPVVAQIRAALPVGARVLVAGSTVAGEEPPVIAAWSRIAANDPRALLILAPRHPERFDEVARLLAQSGHPWQRRSAWQGAPLVAGSVLLLDSIGELASVYALGVAAFVGGSLVDAGGHNPLEPAMHSVPVVVGPYGKNFRAILAAMTEADAIRIVPDEVAMAEAVLALFNDPAAGSAQAQRALILCGRLSGATARSVAAIRAVWEAAQ